MLYETLKHSVIFLSMLYFGLLGGVLYEWKTLITKPINIKWAQIVADIVFCILLFFVFFYAVQFTNYGEIRAFIVISFFLGFYLERITIGFWLAKLSKILYNKFVKVIKRIKIPKLLLKRKIQNEGIHSKTTS
ncbi:MAG: hypothetical protein CVV59_01570 [Tenericutes bacterium HGW-Tenericutes-4]|nr:MAG: hypothetical protein CVV59_01570 [Tenericutes bacterium HGW-Tenericutes-4]